MNYEEQITETRRQLHESTTVRATLQAELDSLNADPTVANSTRHRRIDDLTALVKAIDNGTLHLEGIPFDLGDLLKPLVRRPSPSALRERIEQLEAARDAALAARVDDNAPAGRFRFVGKGKHFVGSGDTLRRLLPDEEIELTHGQLRAFGDKFTRVDEEPQPAA